MTDNDLIAIGLMESARGRRVPEKLSVVGFDDIFGADFTSPPLTTIRTPLRRMGQAAVEGILSRLQGAATPTALNDGAFDTDLTVRLSTAHRSTQALLGPVPNVDAETRR